MPPKSPNSSNFTFASALEKIENSKAFKNFKKENPEAELCAGFFVLDFESEQGKNNQQQLDYCLPDSRIFTFILNTETSEITMKEAEKIQGQEKKKLEKLNPKKIKTDLPDIEAILTAKMSQDKIDKKLNKIIAILHKSSELNKEIWNLNCMLAGFEILQAWIDTENGSILKFEKRSMFDFIKR